MAQLGPFERCPCLAVAVSGGADSMALLLLADHWVRARGGRVVGLTVDHGLRPESADEAQQVGDMVAGHGIEHHILRWQEGRPGAALQENARAARYALLDNALHRLGILHLLVAHHRDDQDETRTMRSLRNSGNIGRAGMSAVRYLRHGRVLRPLLTIRKTALKAYLRDRHQNWIEDPSNINSRFERVRIRKDMTQGGRGVEAGDIHRAVIIRQQAESRIGQILARSVSIDATGMAVIDLAQWREMTADNADVAGYALGHVLRVVGGADHAPAQAATQKALAILQATSDISPRRLSLGGCLIHRRGGWGLICREFGRMDVRVHILTPERSLLWDGRIEFFRLRDEKFGQNGISDDLAVAPLGVCDQSHTKEIRAALARVSAFPGGLPRQAMDVLPVIFYRDSGLFLAPLEICCGSDVLSAAGCRLPLRGAEKTTGIFWRFLPPAPLWGGGFKIVAEL
ncbi:MAG: tRNA lysidine(34) synthetase TilS [Pseudomonadota bacterium]